jgi:hypothetical protein
MKLRSLDNKEIADCQNPIIAKRKRSVSRKCIYSTLFQNSYLICNLERIVGTVDLCKRGIRSLEKTEARRKRIPESCAKERILWIAGAVLESTGA